MQLVDVRLQISQSSHSALDVTVKIRFVLSELEELLLGLEVLIFLCANFSVLPVKLLLQFIVLSLSLVIHLLQSRVKIYLVLKNAALGLELLFSVSESLLADQQLLLEQEYLVFLLGQLRTGS